MLVVSLLREGEMLVAGSNSRSLTYNSPGDTTGLLLRSFGGGPNSYLFCDTFASTKLTILCMIRHIMKLEKKL